MAAVVSASLALVVVPGTAAPQVPGGNVVVDTTKDGNDGECAKDCTLREAIAVADTQAGQWVQLPPGVYKLTLGPLVLGNDVVFGVGFGGNQSAGARTTIIDARGASTVLTGRRRRLGRRRRPDAHGREGTERRRSRAGPGRCAAFPLRHDRARQQRGCARWRDR